MTQAFSPQFGAKLLNLDCNKGESFELAVTVSDYDLDLRSSLVFTEIRRTSPGYSDIAGFTGAVILGGNTISVAQYPKTANKAQILKNLPVRVGDLITLEGSGIKGAKVLAVTDSQIVASTPATRTINEGRLLVRSLSLASFTAVPPKEKFTITATGTAAAGATAINVSGVSRNLKDGITLIFNDASTPKLAKLTREAFANDTLLFVTPLAAEITSTSTAVVGATTILTSTSTTAGATSISIDSLGVPVAANTILNFATRSADGWVFIGSSKLTSSVLAGETSLPVSALDMAIPVDAIAWTGTQPFSSFYLALDPADTQYIVSGDYGYDVAVRLSDGFTLRIMQGNIKLADHWSDGV